MYSLRAPLSALATFAVVAALMTVSVPAADAALPPMRGAPGFTGVRPGATELPFTVSDQVSLGVDVATGNLRVSASMPALVGVTGPWK